MTSLLAMLPSILLLLLHLTGALAYIPAVPTNNTQDAINGGLNVTDVSRLYVQWFGGIDSQSVSYQLVGSGSNGISKGALVHFTEEEARNGMTTTPWIALVSCDGNATHDSLEDDIFTLAREQGAVGAVLFSEWSDACIINPEYANPENFDQVMDIFSTQNLASARVIEGQFEAINVSTYGSFDPASLNSSQAVINDTLQAGYPTAPGYLWATLSAYNATGDLDIRNANNNSANTTPQKSSKTTLAMIVLYAITGCVSAMFCVVIITGAVRAIRHPERYRVVIGGSGGGAGYGNEGRTAVLTRAILDTFPIIKFGRSGTDNADSHGGLEAKDIEAYPEGERTQQSQSLEMKDLHEQDIADATEEAQTGKSFIRASEPADVRGEPSSPQRRESLPKLNTTLVDRPRPGTAVGSSAGPSQETPAPDHPMPDAIGRETCPICILDFEEGDDLRVLPCEGQHKFHQRCVDPWLLELSSSCPLCRHDFHALETMLSGSTEDGHTPIDRGHSPSSPTPGSRFSRYLRFAQRRHRHDHPDPTDPPMPMAPQTAM